MNSYFCEKLLSEVRHTKLFNRLTGSAPQYIEWIEKTKEVRQPDSESMHLRQHASGTRCMQGMGPALAK